MSLTHDFKCCAGASRWGACKSILIWSYFFNKNHLNIYLNKGCGCCEDEATIEAPIGTPIGFVRRL